MTAAGASSGAARPRPAGAHFEIYSRAPGEFHWRLLSANNRDSGQSWASFPDAAACRAGLDSLIELLGRLRPLYTPTADQRWQWALALGDVPLARSSRSFDRRLRCVAACDRFIEVAPLATARTAQRSGPDPPPDPAAVRPLFTFTPLPRYSA
jgi:hypothetical protein